MFERLQQKWKVNGFQLMLILCTFAIGGSLTGYLGKKLINLFDIETRVLWIIVYIIIVTLIWPMAVMLISIPFGQYRFFTAYLKKMGRRMGVGRKQFEVRSSESGVSSQTFNPARKAEIDQPGHLLRTTNPIAIGSELPTHIAIFASGMGSNAKKIIEYFKKSELIKVALVVCNNPAAGVLKIASTENIPVLLIDKERFFRGDAHIPELKAHHVDFIVLAGFLWKIPGGLINAFPGRIINIHPALLPGFGGKGMYGNRVHEAVIAAGEKESGITIHYVDGHYDNGDIIFQAKCPVEAGDTAESLASRVHQLEHKHYPRVIENLILQNKKPASRG